MQSRTLLTLCIVFSSLLCSAQRCGSTISFRLYDSTDSLLYPNASTFVLIENKLQSAGTKIHVKTKEIIGNVPNNLLVRNNDSIVFFTQPSGCGILLWHLQIKKDGKKMNLKFRNIEMDTDYLIDSIPFKEGNFTIDLETIDKEKARIPAQKDPFRVWYYVVNGKLELREE